MYTCKNGGTPFYGPTSYMHPSGTAYTNGGGGASFTTECFWGYWNSPGVTLNIVVTVGGTTATGSNTG